MKFHNLRVLIPSQDYVNIESELMLISGATFAIHEFKFVELLATSDSQKLQNIYVGGIREITNLAKLVADIRDLILKKYKKMSVFIYLNDELI